MVSCLGKGCRYGFGISFKGGIMFQTCHDVGEQHVQNSTYNQRANDTDRHTLFGVFGLLGSRTDGIKTNKGKEYNTCCTEYTTDPVMPKIAFLKEIEHADLSLLQ